MRKLLSETQWKVTLTTAGPQTQTLEKNVEAPTQDAAVRRAMQAFPGMNFATVMATSLDPQTTPPGSQMPVRAQQQLPVQPAALRPLQGLRLPGQQQQQQTEHYAIDPKRFSFPYAITLPAQFARLLTETAPVAVNESQGQYRIVLQTETHMREFLNRLRASRNRDAVGVIIDGMRSSLA